MSWGSRGGCGEGRDFGGEDEVAFRQTLDFMGPDLQFNPAPGEENIGMMPLFLGDLADAVGESERLGEVFEMKLFFEVMVIDASPSIAELGEEFLDRRRGEGRGSAFAGDTGFGGEITGCHERLGVR